MELVDRYLDAVKRHLPAALQDDIVTELRDDIESQIEAKESQLDRPLSIDEQSEILKAYGPPLVAASRFGKHQYLIGPTLYPYYINTLKIVLCVVLGLMFAGAAIEAVVTPGDHVEPFFMAWGSMWGSLFWVVGVITVIFVIQDRVSANWPLKNFDPRKLPRIQTGRPISRVQTIFELVFQTVALFWLIDVPGVRSAVWRMMTGPGSAIAIPLSMTQVWQQLFAALIIVSLIIIAADCINLIRPEWTRLRAAVMVLTNTFLVVVLCLILQSHTLVVPAASVRNLAQYQDAATALNAVVFYSFAIWAVIAAVIAIVNVRVLVRRAKPPLLAVGGMG